jgi:hypothetical protein
VDPAAIVLDAGHAQCLSSFAALRSSAPIRLAGPPETPFSAYEASSIGVPLRRDWEVP